MADRTHAPPSFLVHIFSSLRNIRDARHAVLTIASVTGGRGGGSVWRARGGGGGGGGGGGECEVHMGRRIRWMLRFQSPLLLSLRDSPVDYTRSEPCSRASLLQVSSTSLLPTALHRRQCS
uniref:Uncharacterized protein n=1 Tax=Knipowitschia caucasica TaxID=637954 RepID=A0AAV2M4B3_KNICA